MSVENATWRAWVLVVAATLGACASGPAGSSPPTSPDTGPSSGTFVAVARFDGTSGHGPAPDTERFDGTGSHAASGAATLSRCTWEFGDGAPLAEGCRLAHTFDRAGQYVVTLTATGSDGSAGTSALTVSVDTGEEHGVIAVAQLSGGEAEGPAPLSVTLDASRSRSKDAQAHVSACSWDFGDGSAVEDGCTRAHTYAREGAFTATVTVTDSDGFVDAASVAIQVDAAAALQAVAEIDGADHGPTPFTAAFDGTRSRAADGTGDVVCAWAFGDGSPEEQGCYVQHTYRVSGSFEARLQVTDRNGRSATDSVRVVSQSGGGQTLWALPVPEAFGAVVASNGGSLFAAFDDQKGARVVAYDPTGQSLWSTREASVTFDWIAASGTHVWASGASGDVYGGGVEVRYDADGQNRTQAGAPPEGTTLIALTTSAADDEAEIAFATDAADLLVHGHDGTAWAIHTSEATPILFQRVVFDPFGDVIACGEVQKDFTYQDHPLATGLAVLAFSSTGRLSWASPLEGGARCSGLGTTARGTIVAAVVFDRATTFGGVPLDAGSALVVLDAGGTARWARPLTPTADYLLAVEPDGEATIFGPTPSAGCASAIGAATYNLGGELLWTRTFTPTDCARGQLYAQGIAQFGRDVVLSGSFQGTVDFGTGKLTSRDVSAFVLELAP